MVATDSIKYGKCTWHYGSQNSRISRRCIASAWRRENALRDPNRITAADYLAALEGTARTWVIEAEGHIVAFGTGYRDGSAWALFVHPEHEGSGYGRALHAAIAEWLWSLGHKRLWLGTGGGTRAERFYLAQGWEACGVEPGGDIRLELARPV